MSDDATRASRRARLHSVDGMPDQPDQVPRLLRFRAAHPHIRIELEGMWRAIIPAENGETIVCRYELRDVLDKLDELFGAEGD